MRYRQAAPADGPQLAALRWEFRAEDGAERPAVSAEAFAAAYARFFAAGLAAGSRGHFVAEDDSAAGGGQLVGHLVVQVVELVPRPCRVRDAYGCVTDNYVRPAYRNRGVGARLLAAAVGWARGRDLELLTAWPSERAVPFYARAGFSPENDVMELRLRPDGRAPEPLR